MISFADNLRETFRALDYIDLFSISLTHSNPNKKVTNPPHYEGGQARHKASADKSELKFTL